MPRKIKGIIETDIGAFPSVQVVMTIHWPTKMLVRLQELQVERKVRATDLVKLLVAESPLFARP
jgi:hypothetical protein